LPTSKYDKKFFKSIAALSYSSAKVATPILDSTLQPSVVADVGCGTGEWLKAWQEHNPAVSVIGFDGNAPKSMSRIPDNYYQLHGNLERDKPFLESFHADVVLCLEMAEHIPESDAETLVKLLCHMAPTVVFSAAIPRQGGQGHVNEQWPEYWARLFAKNAYAPLDFIRPFLWNNPYVAYWYAQNMIVYCSHAKLQSNPNLAVYRRSFDGGQLSRVHPRKWAHASKAKPSSDAV
jgi:SAM-dependent methyltransferase